MPENENGRDRAVTLDELLHAPMDSSYYLSWPLIPRGGRIVIGGPAKHFKSFLGLNLSYNLAEGEPLLELKKEDGSPLWTVKKPLVVLYSEKEIGKYRLKERLERIHEEHQGQIAIDNLYLEPKGNEIMLDTPHGLDTLCKQLDIVQPDVLVIDPFRKFHSQDEDSSTEMVRVVYSMDSIQKKYRDLTMIVMHHTGKRSEFRDPTQPESLRGSSIIFDDPDTLIMIDKPSKGVKEKIRLNFVLRSGEDPHPVVLWFDSKTFVFKQKKEEQ